MGRWLCRHNDAGEYSIREIPPRNMVKCILKLQEIGLTSRGSGVDNIRNITATPTAGIDKNELIDTRPFAKAVHLLHPEQSGYVRPSAKV
jgi:sulfite reductase beta subunit-like hemoprotein